MKGIADFKRSRVKITFKEGDKVRKRLITLPEEQAEIDKSLQI